MFPWVLAVALTIIPRAAQPHPISHLVRRGDPTPMPTFDNPQKGLIVSYGNIQAGTVEGCGGTYNFPQNLA
ncbi:hypothetical protein H4R33_000153 [Dimargaris cristalligena]|nr:hypothetical protein H4R33_000153 [Dimargaris cristalligena]